MTLNDDSLRTPLHRSTAAATTSISRLRCNLASLPSLVLHTLASSPAHYVTRRHHVLLVRRHQRRPHVVTNTMVRRRATKQSQSSPTIIITTTAPHHHNTQGLPRPHRHIRRIRKVHRCTLLLRRVGFEHWRGFGVGILRRGGGGGDQVL